MPTVTVRTVAALLVRCANCGAPRFACECTNFQAQQPPEQEKK